MFRAQSTRHVCVEPFNAMRKASLLEEGQGSIDHRRLSKRSTFPKVPHEVICFQWALSAKQQFKDTPVRRRHPLAPLRANGFSVVQRPLECITA